MKDKTHQTINQYICCQHQEKFLYRFIADKLTEFLQIYSSEKLKFRLLAGEEYNRLFKTVILRNEDLNYQHFFSNVLHFGLKKKHLTQRTTKYCSKTQCDGVSGPMSSFFYFKLDKQMQGTKIDKICFLRKVVKCSVHQGSMAL